LRILLLALNAINHGLRWDTPDLFIQPGFQTR